MTDNKLPDWKEFQEIGRIFLEHEQDYLFAIYNNLDYKTWSDFLQLYNSELRLMEAFGRFTDIFIKLQNENNTPFNPVVWFKLQHELASKLKQAVEKSDLETGLQIISDFEKDYEGKTVFNLWRDANYYKGISRDLSEIIGDYERSWNFQKDINNIHSLHYIWRHLKRISPKPLSAELIFACFGEKLLGLTKYGSTNLLNVLNVVNNFLLDYFEEYGNNPIYRLNETFSEPTVDGHKLDIYKKYFNHEADYYGWEKKTTKQCKNLHKANRKNKVGHSLLSEHWFSIYGLTSTNAFLLLPAVINDASYELFKSMFRRAENMVRSSKGIPNIGEGWISETELFYELKEHFSDLKVVQHATPKWLNGQHFDIYFPTQNVAIEYHGKQHFEPVEFFGGEESFKHQRERDLRKIRLAESNGCELIVIRKGYDIESLKNQIESLI